MLVWDIRGSSKIFLDNDCITLTHKELLGTWEENIAMFQTGETVAGIIRSVEPYGIFRANAKPCRSG